MQHGGQIRKRIYRPFQVIRSFLKQILDADHSCSNAVISLAAERLNEGKKAISINTGPYVKARKRLSEEMPHALVKAMGEESLKQVTAAWKPFGREVKLADGTMVQMPDTKANNKEFPKHANKKQQIGFPLARIGAIMSLTTGSVVDYAIAGCKGKGTGEITLLRKILGCIKANDLFVADRLYCNFFLTCDLLKQQADFIVPGHNERRYDFRKGVRLNKKDHIVMWPKPKKPVGMSQRDYAKYPNPIQIREFKVGGTVYITTLLEEKKYPKKERASLYQRRWEAEIHLNSIKTIMGMDQLACKSPDRVKKEIGFYFLAYTIIRYIMVNAALRHEMPPNPIRFKGTLQLLNEFMPYLSTCSSKRKWLLLYNQFLCLIVTKKIGNRPGRCEPRAVRSRPKTFPVLRKSRKAEKVKLHKKANKIIKMIENKALAA